MRIIKAGFDSLLSEVKTLLRMLAGYMCGYEFNLKSKMDILNKDYMKIVMSLLDMAENDKIRTF